MSEKFFAGLDLGSGSIKFLLARTKETELEMENVFLRQEASGGIRRGVIIDIEETGKIVQEILGRAKEETGRKIKSVYVNANGSHLFFISSRGVISVSRADQKISEEDVQRVLNAAQAFPHSFNKEIFSVLPKEFIVDGQGGLKEVIGLEGNRLEAEILALGGFGPYLKNLNQVVLNNDLQILDVIPSVIASARAVLTPRQKELGVMVLDIGAGTTGLAVFEEGDLLYFSVLPIGSANITNDIAVGLKCDIDLAEKIKIEYGSCFLSSKERKEKIKIEDEELVFSQKQLAEIIVARVAEIFSQTNKELKKVGKEKLLPAGVVLTGGGAKLSKISELAKKELKLPVKIGKPREISNLDDPSFATIAGLVLLGKEAEMGKDEFYKEKSFFQKIKRIFKIFIP